MPFFGNILPTLRSYSGIAYGIDGKVTIGVQPFALSMNVALTLGQRLEASGSSVVGQVFGAGQSGEISDKPVRAAQYVRMSTEHQQYSTENQGEASQHYAAQRGIEIVRTYADEGKSGLSLDGRDALETVDRRRPSRKGRFYDHSGLRRQPLGTISGRRRKRLLRIHLPSAPASAFSIAPNSSRMTAARSPPSSRASSARWPANTVASFPSRYSPDSAA